MYVYRIALYCVALERFPSRMERRQLQVNGAGSISFYMYNRVHEL